MKKFFGLLQNELIKIWKQTGYRVMLFVLIGLSCLSPIFGLLTTLEISYTAQDEYDFYMECAEEESGIYREYYISIAESNLFFIDNGISDGWKYEYFYHDYERAYIRAYAARLLENGTVKADELEMSPFVSYLYDSSYSDSDYKYYIPSYAEAKAELDSVLETILTTTEKDITLDKLERSKTSFEDAKTAFDSAKLRYEADMNNSELEYSFKVARETLNAAQMELEAWQAIYDNSASPDSWAYSMAYRLSEVLNMTVSYVAVPEDMYYDNDYGTYLASCERYHDYYHEAASVYLHSIKTNNCLSSLSDSSMLTSLLGGTSFGVSTKTQLRSAIMSFINLATILMVVLASGIISTEFSSGTIRLLVIRPCTRRQIMASKLTAVGVIYVGLVIVMSVLLTAETVLLFGVGDLFAPDTVYLAGNIIDLPFFVLTLERIAVASLVALAYVAVAIILASLTRKNGLAITMSMLIYAFGSTVSLVAILLSQLFPNVLGWIVYTPLAYMSLVSIVPPAHELLSSMGGMFGLSGVELWIGVLYHIIFIAGMVYLTVLAFRKKQIKN